MKKLLLILFLPMIGFSQSNTNITKLSDTEVNEILNNYGTIEYLYYGIYLPDFEEDIKIGYASSYYSIDTLTESKIYYIEELKLIFVNNLEGLVDTSKMIFSSQYNALPPYELIRQDVKFISNGMESIIATKKEGGGYITIGDSIEIKNTYKYSLNDYFASWRLSLKKDDVIKCRSFSMGELTIDSCIIINVQNHAVGGGNMSSYTIRAFNSIDNYATYTDEIFNSEHIIISVLVENVFEVRLESEIQAKDLSYVADLFTLNCISHIPSYPESDYDTTKEVLSTTLEIHGEYNNIFEQGIYQELFKEDGHQYLQLHNFDMHDIANKKESDSILLYEDILFYPINNPKISELANKSIIGADTDSMKISYLLDFVHNYIDWSDNIKWHSNVFDIIKSKKGVCADYAYLFNVLARNLGFPCKEVGGVAFDPVSNSWGGHGWNEIVINNKWYSVDPTWNIWGPTYDHIKTKEESTSFNKFKLSLSEITLEDGSNIGFRSDIGCISGDCHTGYGVWIDYDGNKYTGDFKDGKFDGEGKITYIDGTILEGRFMIGVFIGE